MKVSKEYLGSLLNTYIKRNLVKNRKEFKSKFAIVSSDCGLDLEIIADILNDSKIALEGISVRNLYILTKAVVTMNNERSIYKVTDNREALLNLKDYFTDEEIKQMEKALILYKEDLKNNNQNEIIEELLTFENVLKVTDDQFIAVVPLKKYLSMYDNNLIKYNTIIQRDTKKSLYKNNIIENIDISYSQVKDIRDLVLKGDFIANTITLNVLFDEDYDTIIYDSNNNILKINGEINILDGFHRSLGYQKAFLKSNEIEMNIELRITNFDILKARRFIIQEDKQRKMNLEHIERLEENYINKLLKSINDNSDFGEIITKGKITGVKNLTIPDSAVRNVLTKLFDRSLNSNMEVNLIKEQMIKFLDALYYYIAIKKKSNKLFEYQLAQYLLLFRTLYNNNIMSNLDNTDILNIIKAFDSDNLFDSQKDDLRNKYYAPVLHEKDIKDMENKIFETLKESSLI